MALGAIRSGYQNAYSYPAKAKAGRGGGNFDAVSAVFASNAAATAKQAFSDAKTAAGYSEDGRTSAPANCGGEETVQGVEQEKEEGMDYRKFLQEKIEELYVKLQNGETEPSYQIGAQSFTEKEWDELLEKFDSVEETIRELMREEHEKRETEQIKREQLDREKENGLLSGEFTTCVYPAGDSEKEDIRYITCYTTDGIYCRREGQTEDWEWVLAFENEGQYDKVMQLIGQFPSDWNMRFAAHKNFWEDFLNDEIDVEGFLEFMAGTDKGVPDYSVTVGDSVYIDKEKVQWAKYTNPFGAKFYTAEEMHRMQLEQMAVNEAKLTRITDWTTYETDYRKIHPEYNGEKICCEYPGGPLYSISEMAQIMWKNFLQSQNLTEDEYSAKQAAWRARMGYPGY